MCRDVLFECPCERQQLEFVVDNLAVAGLANSTTAIHNDAYGNAVCRIRRMLSKVYRSWGYKASFLEPVDWRAREWNTGADHLAGYGLTVRKDGGNLSAECVRYAGQSNKALHFFSDGGFVEGVGGAAGVQLLAYYLEDGHMKRHMVGYKYIYRANATSSFEMELLALETALSMAHAAT